MRVNLEQFDAAPLDLLISFLGLHKNYPVNLQPLFDTMAIKVSGAAGIPGHLHGASGIRDGRGVILIDITLDATRQLCTLGHEMGHLFKHLDEQVFRPKTAIAETEEVSRPGWLQTVPGKQKNFLYVREPLDLLEEDEADLIGAYLVVPKEPMLALLAQGFDRTEIAARLGVTLHYLELRVALMLARNEMDE